MNKNVREIVKKLENRGFGYIVYEDDVEFVDLTGLESIEKSLETDLKSTNGLEQFSTELIKNRVSELQKYKDILLFLQSINADTPRVVDAVELNDMASDYVLYRTKGHLERFRNENGFRPVKGTIAYDEYNYSLQKVRMQEFDHFMSSCLKVFPYEDGYYVLLTHQNDILKMIDVVVYRCKRTGSNYTFEMLVNYKSNCADTTIPEDTQEYGDLLRESFGTEPPTIQVFQAKSIYDNMFGSRYIDGFSTFRFRGAAQLEIPEGFTEEQYLNELCDPESSLHFNTILMNNTTEVLTNFILSTMYSTRKITHISTKFGYTS